MRIILAATLASLLLSAPSLAQGTPGDVDLRKGTQNGIAFVSGGVGDAERTAIDAMATSYSVKLVFSAGGAYLSEVGLLVSDESGKALLETTTAGPIFLAKLPAGSYRIHASATGYASDERTVTVPAAGGAPLIVDVPMRASAGQEP